MGTPCRQGKCGNPPYFGNSARYKVSYYYRHIGSHIRAFDCYRNWWLWITLNCIMAVILYYFTEFVFLGPIRVAVVEVRPILSATAMQPKESVSRQCMIYCWYSLRWLQRSALKSATGTRQQKITLHNIARPSQQQLSSCLHHVVLVIVASCSSKTRLLGSVTVMYLATSWHSSAYKTTFCWVYS